VFFYFLFFLYACVRYGTYIGITEPEVRLHPKSNAKTLLTGTSFLSTILPYAIDERPPQPVLYLLIGKHYTGRWGDFRPSLLTCNRARGLANACKHFVKTVPPAFCLLLLLLLLFYKLVFSLCGLR
jgi:hypothetical protein